MLDAIIPKPGIVRISRIRLLLSYIAKVLEMNMPHNTVSKP